MNILSTLFYFEWIGLKRSRLIKWMVAILTLCAAYATYYGYSSTRKQLQHIALLEQLNDSTKHTFYSYFDNQQTADSVRFGWVGMNSLYDGFTAEDFLENNVAINYPNRFSHLSIGARDIYPLYRRVTARSLYYDGGGVAMEDKYVEISNPHKLLAGNFDLSFVLLYLFPLFIIAFCYNILSKEKETGSYPFLWNLPVSLTGIVAVKLMFRFCVVAGMAALFSLMGYVWSPVEESFSFPLLLQWIGLTTLYLLLWFGISWIVVSLQFTSPVSALALLGCWIMFLIVVPALINNYVAATHKITSRTALVEELNKQVRSIWDLPDSITLSAYYRDYPQYTQTPFKPLWTAADSFDSLGKNEDADRRYNKKIMVWHYYLDKQIQQPLQAYLTQIVDRQAAAEKFAFVNPVIVVQEAMNELAFSGYRHQQRFRMATAAYRDTIFSITNRYVFENKKLSLEDYKSYPEFELNKYCP